jgi:hypothetical protein
MLTTALEICWKRILDKAKKLAKNTVQKVNHLTLWIKESLRNDAPADTKQNLKKLKLLLSTLNLNSTRLIF